MEVLQLTDPQKHLLYFVARCHFIELHRSIQRHVDQSVHTVGLLIFTEGFRVTPFLHWQSVNLLTLILWAKSRTI